MTCKDVKRYLHPFLDNELTAKENLEIQEHLERCPVCRRGFEIERGLRAFLQDQTRGEEAPPGLWERIIERIKAESRPASLWGRVPQVLSSRRASALALSALFLLFASLPLRDGLFPWQPTAAIAEMLEGHFRLFAAPVPLSTMSGVSIKKASAGDKTFVLETADLEEKGLRLAGKRAYLIAGRRGIQFAFDTAGRRLSYYVLESLVLDPAEARRQSVEGKDFYILTLKTGYWIIFWQEGDLLCVVVSDMGEEELLKIAVVFDKAIHV